MHAEHRAEPDYVLRVSGKIYGAHDDLRDAADSLCRAIFYGVTYKMVLDASGNGPVEALSKKRALDLASLANWLGASGELFLEQLVEIERHGRWIWRTGQFKHREKAQLDVSEEAIHVGSHDDGVLDYFNKCVFRWFADRGMSVASPPTAGAVVEAADQGWNALCSTLLHTVVNERLGYRDAWHIHPTTSSDVVSFSAFRSHRNPT